MDLETEIIKVKCIYQGKSYIVDYNSNILTKTELIKKFNENDYNLDKLNANNCFLILNGKIITKSLKLNKNNAYINEIFINLKLKGGKSFLKAWLTPIGSFVKKALDAFFWVIMKAVKLLFKNTVLRPIYDIIKGLVDVISFFIEVTFYLFKLTIWFIRFTLWIMFDVVNPTLIVDDTVKGIKHLTFTIFYGMYDILFNLFKILTNYFANTVANSFWGWDQVPRDKWDREESEYLNRDDPCKSNKCFVTKKNTVPFSIIIGTIICPPVGVFMKYGFTGWLNIIVCCLLTLMFYFPGLIYGLISIYC